MHPNVLEHLCNNNYNIQRPSLPQRSFENTLDQTTRWLLVELRVKDLPLKRHQADERLDHASREDGRPAPARGLFCGDERRTISCL